MKKNNITRLLLIGLPILIAVAVFFFAPFFSGLLECLPPCTLRKYTGLLCPGCGNTRAVSALLRMDILSSLRLNPAPFLTVVLLFWGYTETACRAFDKRVRLLPRNFIFWILLIAVFLIYCILRNIYPFLSLA